MNNWGSWIRQIVQSGRQTNAISCSLRLMAQLAKADLKFTVASALAGGPGFLTI
jgi:hypothetical protein